MSWLSGGLQEPEFELLRVNFSEILIKGKEVEFKLAGNSSFIRVRVNRVKMTETWGEIKGKWNVVRVSGEFALSKFEVSGFCCIYSYFEKGCRKNCARNNPER